MSATEEGARRYPRPPANDRFVWQRVAPSGRMVDLETGDSVSVHGADREHRMFILYLRDKSERIGRVFEVQLKDGSPQDHIPFSVRLTSMRDPIGSPKAHMSDERVSVERLSSFLTAWPALNEASTRDFVVELT